MGSVSLKIETFACEMCGYYQTAEPFTPGEMSRMFPEFPGIPDGACPACYSGRNAERVRRTCQLSRLAGNDIATTTTSASDQEPAEREIEEVDTHGNVIMEQVGERYELRVNPQTGEIYSEPVPFIQPKMRALTTQELAELKLQRDQNRDVLEAVAVKGV